MKNILALAFVLALSTSYSFAQTDLLDMVETPAETFPVKATFKSTRIMNAHSVEQMAAKHLDFRIMHRFGTFGTGSDEMYGLDAAKIRLSLEYGITDKLMIGFGRNNFGRKAYDGFVKYKLLQQSTGPNAMPFTLSVLGSGASDINKGIENLSSINRLAYTWQVLAARKFSEGISLQLMPTFVHRNYVANQQLNNDVFFIGAGGRFKLNKRTSFNVEYFQHLTSAEKITTDSYTPMLTFGFDIETGGHVFQLLISNNQGMIEKDFLLSGSAPLKLENLLFGFNISRTFSFDNTATKW
jgi:hypothetical protein